MWGRSSTTVLEERPLHVTLALQRRPVDSSRHLHGVGGRAESPTAQVSSSVFAELIDVGDFEHIPRGSLDSSLGIQPPLPLDSHFAASCPESGVFFSGTEVLSLRPIGSSAVSPRKNMLLDKVQDALASTRIVVGLFSPSSDDITMLEMLKEKLSSLGGSCQASDGGQSNNDDDFFEMHGGHRVLTTFKAILGEQPFKELLAATIASRERSQLERSTSLAVQDVDIIDAEQHGVGIDSALKMILAIPKNVATRDDVQAKLKPMWTRVCEHAELRVDGTPRKKKEMQKLDIGEKIHFDAAPGPPSQQRRLQQRRMTDRLIAIAAQSAVQDHDQIRKVHDEESSRGLRRSKRIRGWDNKGSSKEKQREEEEEDQEASENHHSHQEMQSRHDVEVAIVNDQQDEDLKEMDYVDAVQEKSHVDEKKREREEKDVDEKDFEKDDDPEIAQAKVLMTLIEEDAKANVELLESLTKDAKMNGSKEVKIAIPVEDLTPPSAIVEAERAERFLFEDGGNGCLEELRSCLSADPLDESSMSMGLIRSQQHQKPVERIGVLMRWWRVVRRSFAFAGLWRALEKKRSRTKKRCRKSLKDMYHAKMEEIKSHSNGSREGQRQVEVEGQIGSVRVYGYDQVVKYVQLGEFLIQYPQFVMQTLRSRLSDWLKPLKVSLPPCSDSLEKDVEDGNSKGQKRRPFIDVIKELLLQSSIDDSSLKRKDFDNKSSVKKMRTNAGGRDACRCCSNDDDDVVKCTECDCLFHEHCAGYEKGMCLSTLSTVGNQQGFFEGRVYCPDCLDEKQLTVMDVKDSLREQHGLAEYLNGEDCPYVFKHVDRDGFCLFRNLVEFVREEESLLITLGEGDTIDAVLCGKIIDESLKMTEALRCDLGDDAVDSDALKALMDVQQDVKGIVRAIKSRWLDLDAEQIIRGFVQMFQGRVAVKVFRLSPNHPQVTEQVYPEERNGAECVICMFHWHSLLHFDRLKLKQP